MGKKRKALARCGPNNKVIFFDYVDAVIAGWHSARKWGKSFRPYACLDHWHVSSRPDRYGLPKKKD